MSSDRASRRLLQIAECGGQGRPNRRRPHTQIWTRSALRHLCQRFDGRGGVATGKQVNSLKGLLQDSDSPGVPEPPLPIGAPPEVVEQSCHDQSGRILSISCATICCRIHIRLLSGESRPPGPLSPATFPRAERPQCRDRGLSRPTGEEQPVAWQLSTRSDCED